MRSIIILPIVLLLTACQGDPTSEIDIQENLLVIDGWLYSNSSTQTIKLSRSVGFQREINFEPVVNASVLIRNSLQSEELLTEKSSGEYVTGIGFTVSPGNAYQLEIRLQSGEIYLSDFEPLLPVPDIDTLILEPILEEIEEPADEPRLYFPVASVNEFEERGNFYRWKLSRNGVVFNTPSDIILQSDRFVNGNSFRNEFKEYLYSAQDSTGVRLESLTRNAYDFLRFFRRQTVDLGTSGGTSPGALRGNIRNRDNPDEVVLGYFGASDVSTAGKTLAE
ncbi:MAG: DUF4249 domain-containing protein [Cyclobacteriaceae bacterium]